MAVIWQTKNKWFTSKKTNIVKTVESEPTKIVATNVEAPKEDPTMKAILARLEAQDKEIALLKDPQDPNKDAKVVYAWPRKYSFSLWTGIPVLSIEYFLKDPEADLVYKNERNQWVENQYVKLNLLWWKVIETSNYLYNKNKTKSGHEFAKTNTDELGKTTYTFNDPKHGEFTILDTKFIN